MKASANVFYLDSAARMELVQNIEQDTNLDGYGVKSYRQSHREPALQVVYTTLSQDLRLM